MKMDRDFLEYGCLDAACTLEIKNNFWPDLDDGYSPAYNMTIDLFPVLMFMQTRGIRVDHDLLNETKVEVLAKQAQRQAELDSICGFHLNVNSPQQCQQYFYITKGIPPYRNGQSITTDDMAMQRIARGTATRPGLREAKLVQEIRSLGKLYGTYLNIEFDEDSRMRCSFNPRGTKFGRLSSSKTVFGTGTNMQNLMQEFKKFLVPDPGYCLVEMDKRQAEWVATAYISGDANMIFAIEEGIDVHVHTASRMFNIPAEVVYHDSKMLGHEVNPDAILEIRMNDPILRQVSHIAPRTMSFRQTGKKSNHGLNYDERYKNFALINEIPEGEARKVVDGYHAIYPGIRIWYDSVKRLLQKDRTLTNCFGRKVRFMGRMDDDMYKSAYSMLPQSSIVDSLNQGMVRIYNDSELCGSQGYNIDILAQVHDSILFQIPLEWVKNGRSFAAIQERIYEYLSPEMSYNGRTFRVATDTKIGMNWGGFSKEHNPGGMVELKALTDVPAILAKWRN